MLRCSELSKVLLSRTLLSRVSRVLLSRSRAGPEKRGCGRWEKTVKGEGTEGEKGKEKDCHFEREAMYIALLASRDPQQGQI